MGTELVIDGVFVLVSLILPYFQKGYQTLRHEFISELVLGRFGWIQKLSFFVCGIAFVTTGVDKILIADNLIQGLYGLGTIIMGVGAVISGGFDTDRQKEPATMIGKLHNLGYFMNVYFFIFFCVMLLIFVPNLLMKLNVFFIVNTLYWFVWGVRSSQTRGLAQRALVYPMMLWHGVLGILLFR